MTENQKLKDRIEIALLVVFLISWCLIISSPFMLIWMDGIEALKILASGIAGLFIVWVFRGILEEFIN